MHTNFTSLYPEQRARLRAFRNAAADLYRALGDDVGAGLSVGSRGRSLLSEQVLRAAVPALRLTLLDGEKANFERTTEALWLLHDPEIAARVDRIKSAWRLVEEGQIRFYSPDQALHGRRIRDAWLYGRVTHQHDEWSTALETLAAEGDLAVFALQAAVLGHARLVMALDAVIADVLGEPHIWNDPEATRDHFFG